MNSSPIENFEITRNPQGGSQDLAFKYNRLALYFQRNETRLMNTNLTFKRLS